ncbi:related to mitotic checkpoint protein BUB3 [Ustilago trichophora]|uniref:Related to mitotic checkpoint protein BUB3 n=1 Tax=Ustilago trichophora TaxID=86804 RepID=A0A5C3EEP4_9BASI|nr:related to mitotic checkpoint protein BUB3 [Ustilago trichophora]
MSRPTSSSTPHLADLLFPDPPKATVSSLVFSPTPSPEGSTDVLVSSWDHYVYHYRVQGPSSASSSTTGDGTVVVKVQSFPHEAPVLDVCFISDTLAASASVDRRVRLLDLTTGKSLIVGKHDDSVLKLRFCTQTQLLISGGADRKLCFWSVDLNGRQAALLKTLDVADKVIAMDISPPFFPSTPPTLPIYSASRPGQPNPLDPTPRLVIGMTGRHVYVYDLHPLKSAIDREQAGEKVAERDFHPDQRRESSLKFMARDLRCMPAGDGYATSSIEGRIAVEFFDPSAKSQAMKYAFKCHRETVDGVMDERDLDSGPHDVVYPVQGMAFHPRHGTFASLGGDAVISVWDAAAKKRIRQYPKLSASITAGAFDSSGKMLLVATGNDSLDQVAKQFDKDKVTLVLKPNAWEESKPKIKSSSTCKPTSKK